MLWAYRTSFLHPEHIQEIFIFRWSGHIVFYFRKQNQNILSLVWQRLMSSVSWCLLKRDLCSFAPVPPLSCCAWGLMFSEVFPSTICINVLTVTFPSYRLAQSYFEGNLLISWLAKEANLFMLCLWKAYILQENLPKAPIWLTAEAVTGLIHTFLEGQM